MPFEKKTDDYKTHKHKYNVYVELNPKTKMGKDLLNQYHEQTDKHYMDIGRIGYHNDHGEYIIDEYTKKELIVVPKLILRVTERAIDRAGKDVYQLRTYMSKFGQINFLLTVDKDKADLILVENVYIENLNHREDYETLLWRLSYYNQKPVPLKEIFYKVGIKANPDDYGKAWKEEEVNINNVLVAKVKAEMTKDAANKIASQINQKALVASLNYLNKEGEYGKKITTAYSKKVSNNPDINKLATSPKLESTLNHVLVKTLEEETTKKDLKDNYNFRVYKKVLDVQLSTPNQIEQEVEEVNNKQNLKQFLVESYQKPKKDITALENEEEIINQKQDDFERIIDFKYDRKTKKENIIEDEIVFDPESEILPEGEENVDFCDFEGNVVEVNLNTDRFNEPEEEDKKRKRERDKKLADKEEKKDKKQKQKEKKKLRALNAECNVDEEFEKSKTVLGLEPEDSQKKKKKRQKDIFAEALEEEKKNKKLTKEEKLQKALEEESQNEKLIDKIQKKIKNLASKKQKKEEKEELKQQKQDLKSRLAQEKEEEKKKKKNIQNTMAPVVKPPKEQEEEAKKKKNQNTALMESVMIDRDGDHFEDLEAHDGVFTEYDAKYQNEPPKHEEYGYNAADRTPGAAPKEEAPGENYDPSYNSYTNEKEFSTFSSANNIKDNIKTESEFSENHFHQDQGGQGLG